MPEVRLDLTGNFEGALGTASRGFSNFVTGLNQGLQLIENLGGRAFAALDDVFNTAGSAESLGLGLENLAGGSAEAAVFIEAMGEASRGTISQLDAMKLANQALLLGVVDNGEQMGELTKIAVALGKTMGLDTKYAVESLTTGVGRQSKLWLDNLGILVNTEEAYETMAKTLRVSVSDLTDAEKKQAFLNATLDAGRDLLERTGEFQLTTTQNWKRFGAEVDDARVDVKVALAEAFGPLLQTLMDLSIAGPDAGEAVRDLAAGVSAFGDDMRAYAEDPANLDWLGESKRSWKDVAAAVFLAKDALTEHGAQLQANAQADAMQAEFIERVNKALGKNFTTFEEASKAARENRSEVRQAEDAQREIADALEEASRKANEQAAEFQDLAQQMARTTLTTEELAATLDMSEEALDLLGLTGEDTSEALQGTAKAAVEAFETVQRSGQFSAEKLYDTWVDEVVPSLIDAYGEIPPEFAAIEDQLRMETKAGMEEWLLDQRATIEENKATLADPITDAVLLGFEQAEPGIEELGESFGQACVGSMAEFMRSPAGRQELSGILGDLFQPRGIVDSPLGGADIDSLDARAKADLDRLKADVAGDSRANQALSAALAALEAGDLGFVKTQMDGMAANIQYMHRHFNMALGDNKEKAEEYGRILATLKTLIEIYDVEIGGHNSARTRFGAGPGASSSSSSQGGRGGQAAAERGPSPVKLDDATEAAIRGTSEATQEASRLLAELLGAELDRTRMFDNSPAAAELARLADRRRDRVFGSRSTITAARGAL